MLAVTTFRSDAIPPNLHTVTAAQANRHPSLVRLIAIDARNLALLRIGLATIILVDLAQRVGSINAFYTDEGVLDRELNRWLCSPGNGFWSLYWLGGSAEFAFGLMAVNALAALGLLLGFKSRWSTAICLVLAYSLQIRNPLVLTAGHILLRMLLFWSLFLPLGAVWSWDAWRARRRRARDQVVIGSGPNDLTVASIGTVAIMIQVAAMYLFSGLAKWNEVWLRGDAMSLAMQLDMYVKPLGRVLLEWPQLLMLTTFLILILETVGPLLLWMPPANAQWRVALMVLFWLMHLGIWLTMSIGIFSAIAMLSWVVFWPRGMWRGVPLGRSKPDENKEIAASEGPSVGLGVLPSLLCGLFLVYVIGLNVANMEPAMSQSWFGRPLRTFGNATMVLQQFKMFDRPATDNLWWRLVARDKSGPLIDMLPRIPQPLGDLEQRPSADEVYSSMPNQLWRRMLFNLATMDEASGEHVGKRAIARWRTANVLWNAKSAEGDRERMASAELICFRQRIVLTDDERPIIAETWGRAGE